MYLPIPKVQEEVSLEDCFEQFRESEFMDGDNAMNCARCERDMPTVKTMVPYELNDILIIILKRFFEGSTKKDDKEVKIPFRIDADMISKEERRDNSVYDLYGMITHSGLSIQSGHYTADCYDEMNGWVHYNDSHCSQVSERDVSREARDAYVLMYRRK